MLEKIEIAISEAEHTIMKWYINLIFNNEMPKTFKEWVVKLKSRFSCNTMTLAQYARICQSENESVADFLQRMEDQGEILNIEPKERFSIAMEGIRAEDWILKAQLLNEETISTQLIVIW